MAMCGKSCALVLSWCTAFVLSADAAGQGSITELVSVSSAGVPGNGNSDRPAITPDGRYVAFESLASNLVLPDAKGKRDIFLRDRLLGTTERISVNSAGMTGDDHSWTASLSDDARFVAFSSHATNLVTGDTNNQEDVFVRDRLLGTTVRVSVTTAGVQGNDVSDTPVMSPDGSRVFFTSEANLDPPLSSGARLVYSHDLTTGTTVLETWHPNMNPGQGHCWLGRVTPDLRYLLFMSEDGQLVPNDTNFTIDVFVKDRVLGTYERVNVDSNEQQGVPPPPFWWDFNASSATAISDDGRFVLFHGEDAFDPVDVNPAFDIYLRDRLLGTTACLSPGSEGPPTEYWDSVEGLISADARLVLFSTSSKALVPGKTTGIRDLVVRHLLHDVTSLLIKGWDGTEVNDYLDAVRITPGARTIAFKSWATNIVPMDLNGKNDVFVVTFAPWSDLGFGLAGTRGVPHASATGGLLAGQACSLDLVDAALSAPCALFVSLDSVASSFKGGTLVAVPPALLLFGQTDAAGEMHLPMTWPAGIPSSLHFDLQFAIVDAGAPHGMALSNALDAVTP